ncbi:MAG: GAF domain-containing protein [Pseudomonadota bacterium]
METFAVDLAEVPAPVHKVIANRLLAERPSRTPDYKSEVEATTEVIKALRETPGTVLKKLSDAVRTLTNADSAGVSLSGRDQGKQIFLWQAAVGLFEKYLGSVVLHEESPCGCVLETDSTLLMVNPGDAYKTAAQVQPPIREVLLVPFHVEGRVAGTVWVISQSAKTFDAEDARIVKNISELAALAYQTLIKLDNLELLSKTVQLVADDQFKERELVFTARN